MCARAAGRKIISDGASASCNLKEKRKHRGSYIAIFFQKGFTFSSYSETIYSVSISRSCQTEHHGIIFASGKREKK